MDILHNAGNSEKKPKVLIIRFSSIGDILLTTPLVRCIKNAMDAEIYYLTREPFVPIIANNPYIFRILQKEKTSTEQLKELQFDHVFDLQKNFTSIRLTRMLQVPVTRFEKLNIQKWILVNTKLNFLPEKHLADRYFEAAKPLHIEDDGMGCDYFIQEKNVSGEIQGLQSSAYDIIVLGAKHATKRISFDKASEIIKLHRRTIILLGGNDVIDMAAMLKKDFPSIINLTGRTNLDESAFIMRHAILIYTGDTGMMHLAAALQKKIVVLWGNTVPAFGMYPYFGDNQSGRSLYFENKEVGCRPCSKLGFPSCPKGHFDCMEKIRLNPYAIEAFENE